MDYVGFAFSRHARSASLTLLTALIGLALSSPSPAQAQTHILYRENADSLICVMIESCDVEGGSCDGGRTCETLPSGSLGCVATGGSSVVDVFCCQSNSDCESGGICSDTIDGASGFGMCINEPYDYFCEDPASVNLGDVEKCLGESPTGDILSDWYIGDCDGDGLTNVEDACYCDEDNTCVPDDSPDGGPSSGTSDLGFTGKGGCSLTPFAPSSPLPWLLPLLAAPLLLILHRRRRA